MALTLSDIDFAHAPGTPFETHALRGVSLEVSPGELVLVVGATGSGKSTLLRLAGGLLPMQAGSVAIDGANITPRSVRGRVGVAFQNPEQQLFADTVLDDVAFGPRNLGLSADGAGARARESLADVGLDPDEFGPRSPFTLSGGEARRVALAGVLAMHPEYVLLDEPSAGLDGRGRESLGAVVEHIRARAGVVIVSHDADEFLGIADRTLVLADGSPVYWGDTAGLVDDPSPFEAGGLIAPEILRLQQLARSHGAMLESNTLDETVLVSRLIASREGGA